MEFPRNKETSYLRTLLDTTFSWGFLEAPKIVIFFFPYNPHPPPPIPTKPPGRPTREGLISVHFGSIWLRSGLFGSVWLRFGSLSGPFRVRFGGVGWGRGGVGERGYCKGKEYHYQKTQNCHIIPEGTNHISELIFGKGMRTATFHFSESGGSLNGPDLFTELPFL